MRRPATVVFGSNMKSFSGLLSAEATR